jgi:hypothetical protein
MVEAVRRFVTILELFMVLVERAPVATRLLAVNVPVNMVE